MIFNTLGYYVLFLIPAAALFRIVPARWRPLVCVAFGAAFYSFFSLTAIGGAAGALCLSIFAWEALCSRLYRPGSPWCFLGIVQALAVLFSFKYWNFFTGLVAQGIGRRENALAWSGAFLPLGVSFFTFEFIHYASDRYRGRAENSSLLEYLAFILFFPTMVAGPIKRWQDFLPTLRDPSRDWARDWERGITRILSGSVKKFAVADVMTAFTDHLNAKDIQSATRWVLPIWLLAYGVQIYFDFSGYSDIAIGSARLFGLSVKENFDWPYARDNIASFWRHWHMSLTRWLTDYVFIPLGGSRSARRVVYMNVLATMLVSGLWHGAGLNFVVWGAWHGLLLCIHRWWTSNPAREGLTATGIGSFLSWALTFLAVQAGWAFFVMDVTTSLIFFRRLAFG
jgi:alginate O-acetyltransferase complex protein AlgI